MCIVHLLWCAFAVVHKCLPAQVNGKTVTFIKVSARLSTKTGFTSTQCKCHQVFTEVNLAYFNFCTRIDLLDFKKMKHKTKKT